MSKKLLLALKIIGVCLTCALLVTTVVLVVQWLGV